MRDDAPQRRPVGQPGDTGGGEGGVEIGVGQTEGRQVDLAAPRALVDLVTERIDLGEEVAAHAVGVHQRVDPGLAVGLVEEALLTLAGVPVGARAVGAVSARASGERAVAVRVAIARRRRGRGRGLWRGQWQWRRWGGGAILRLAALVQIEERSPLGRDRLRGLSIEVVELLHIPGVDSEFAEHNGRYL